MRRRTFLGNGFLGFFALLVSSCIPSHQLTGAGFLGDGYVGKTRVGRFKRFYIHYVKSFRKVRGEDWRLRITGRVENPLTLSLKEVRDFPGKVQVSRLKCVECWSARAQWEGFHFSELEKKVRPLPGVIGVLFRCADSYQEFLTLEDLNQTRTIMVHRMNGETLSPEHGFPLRVIIPFKYGYKSPKAILEMEFVDKVIPGTWSRIGPYSVDGTILPGHDTPLDGDGTRRRISGGEVFD